MFHKNFGSRPTATALGFKNKDKEIAVKNKNGAPPLKWARSVEEEETRWLSMTGLVTNQNELSAVQRG
jgi:hypothetical protein